jgi:A/G-specific adenine glycosylase
VTRDRTRRVKPPGVAKALLAWYGRAGRDLPWRRSRDPYRIWVSEVMLQQTQVERVREFFARFIARLPTVAALAAAREAEVLRLWEGLGYYRRARQLHQAAQRIMADHAGEFPRTAAALRGLPGIGRYTAGAIASIAFDEPEPIVEANSRRVIARLVGHAAAVGDASGDEPLWRAAAALVPRRQPGRFNQALMDLGAMVCTPDAPRCGDCPLARMCVARRAGTVALIPAPTRRRPVLLVRETAVVVRRAGRVLVVRRGADEWWSGLWDFPRVAGPAVRSTNGIAAPRRTRRRPAGAAGHDRPLGHAPPDHARCRGLRRHACGRSGRGPTLGRGRGAGSPGDDRARPADRPDGDSGHTRRGGPTSRFPPLNRSGAGIWYHSSRHFPRRFPCGRSCRSCA